MRLVFTAHQRPFYLSQVMDHWLQVRGFEDWSPTMFLEPSPSQNAMTAIAKEAGVSVRLNQQRLGVLRNPWHALEAGFISDEFVVLAEDDVLVSDDILEYFTWAADEFRNDTVLAVCAASFRETTTPEQEHLALRHDSLCPLIWGTWRNRWTHLLRDTWDFDYSSGTPEQPQSGWDWNINLRIIPDADVHIISPLASRSTHIGEHLGVHTTAETFPSSVAATFNRHRPPGTFRTI